MTSQRGLSLIELLVFIVVVGIAVTGVLSVYSLTSRNSVDPMIRKQAASIAESLLEEVLGQSFTYCYPNDANVTTASSPAGCATFPAWPQPGTDRYSNTAPYDSVLDYNGFSMPAPPGILDFTGAQVAAGLAGYAASVQVQPAGAFNGIPAGETLLVTVTVTGPGNYQVSLSGYRTRYAPNL
jgi:MSHA pilin protein MshD